MIRVGFFTISLKERRHGGRGVCSSSTRWGLKLRELWNLSELAASFPDMRSSILATYLFALSSGAFGQPVSVGMIGGASLTQDFQNRGFGFGTLQVATYTSTPLRWIAGGLVQVRLPSHLSVEVDGLYHDLAFTVHGFGRPDALLHVVTWEVPVLVKYRFPLPGFSLPKVEPFIEAGPSFRTAYNLNGALPSGHGFAAGVGTEVHAWKLRIAPQVRYVRWVRDDSHVILRTVPDQAQFLVSISF